MRQWLSSGFKLVLLKAEELPLLKRFPSAFETIRCFVLTKVAIVGLYQSAKAATETRMSWPNALEIVLQ
jgi:hypothetical protein